MMFRISLALLPLLSIGVQATTYARTESWYGSGFVDGFRAPYEAYDNTTNGDVFWAAADNTSLIYVNDADRVIMKVDNTSFVPYNDKRYSSKLYSKNQYDIGTVWVMDATHTPYGCSVWPALFTHGENWPVGGEIDIFESINLRTRNQYALHVESQSCTAQSVNQLGNTTATTCGTTATDTTGCTVNSASDVSYGVGFANAGGGVYVCEFASDGIRIWFFARSDVPITVTRDATSMDTSLLGTPDAEYLSSGCDISSSFTPQHLVIGTTLCGDWAGLGSILAETCPALEGDKTCYTTYVIDDAATTYANAYFELNYINVFSSSSSVSSGSSTSSSSARVSGTGATTTISTGPGATTTAPVRAGNGAGARTTFDGLVWTALSSLGVLALLL